MRINISAELLDLPGENAYADWEIAEVREQEDETIVEVGVSGFDDADLLDLTPIFSVLQRSEDSIGDQFYLKEVQFNPSQVVATLVLTTENILTDEPQANISETVRQREDGFHVLSTSVLQNVSYENPPYLIGECSPVTNLSLESRS